MTDYSEFTAKLPKLVPNLVNALNDKQWMKAAGYAAAMASGSTSIVIECFKQLGEK